MTTYKDLKAQEQAKYNELLDKCQVFWAFSKEQFEEGKAKYPIAEGAKYASIGAGGYMPSSNVDEFIAGNKAIEKWKKQARKEVKAEEAILYELNNHEAFYTGTIADAMEVLGPIGYTTEQVKKVYHANRPFAIN